MRVRLSLLAALIGFAASQAASAADIPARPVYKAPLAAPAFSWTGFYVGANAGYGFGRSTGGLQLPLPGNFDIDGGLGGGQVGFNYQFAPHVVIGIEADYQWAGIEGGGSVTIGPVTLAATEDVKRFGTVRGRLGYVWDRWMLYGTGGWAFGARTESSIRIATPAVTILALDDARTLDGWTAGAGVEYAFAPNWSAKVEYLHVGLGTRSYFPTACPGGGSVDCLLGANIDMVRAGLNYRFGSAWR